MGSSEHPSFPSTCSLDGVAGADVAHPDDPKAWYCRANGGQYGALILPVTTFSRMWSGTVLGNVSERPGDFAAATIVAHEVGHHVGDELAVQTGVPETVGAKGPELVADCFTGSWAVGANAQGYPEPGDLEERASPR